MVQRFPKAPSACLRKELLVFSFGLFRSQHWQTEVLIAWESIFVLMYLTYTGIPLGVFHIVVLDAMASGLPLHKA